MARTLAKPGRRSSFVDAATIILHAEGGGYILQKRYILRAHELSDRSAFIGAKSDPAMLRLRQKIFNWRMTRTEPAGH